MSYHIKIYSDQNEDFQRVIAISPESTFLDLHKIISKTLNLDDRELSSFYLCDQKWIDELEITLEDMSFDDNAFTPMMANTTLEEQLIMVGQNIRYVNDYVQMNEVKLEFIEDNGTEPKGTKLPAVIFEDGDLAQLGLGQALDLNGIDPEILQKLQLENFDKFHSLEDSGLGKGSPFGASLDDADLDEDDEDEDDDEFGFDDWSGGGRKGGGDDDY